LRIMLAQGATNGCTSSQATSSALAVLDYRQPKRDPRFI
jgi:hypothetical protein